MAYPCVKELLAGGEEGHLECVWKGSRSKSLKPSELLAALLQQQQY